MNQVLTRCCGGPKKLEQIESTHTGDSNLVVIKFLSFFDQLVEQSLELFETFVERLDALIIVVAL